MRALQCDMPGTAKAIEEDVPASAEETAQEAMENCPVGAIGQV